jgi:uncharacterized membrane protein YdjX (TVP38/TMEM64 family)
MDERRRKRAGKRILLLLGAGVAGLVLARLALREHLDLRAAVAFLQRLDEFWWSMPAYLGIYVVLTAAFAPAVLFHAAAGVTWGFKVAMVLNVLACNGAASLQFLAARKLGRDRVRWILERKAAAGVDRLLSHSGFEAALLIRLMPLPTMAVNVAGGLSSIRWRHFALGTFFGTLPIIVIYTWFASELAQGLAGTESRILRNLVIAGAGLLTVAAIPKAVMAWRKRRGKPPLA